MEVPRRVIYGWETHGLVLEREDRLDAQHELGHRVAHTKTFGDLRELAEFDDRFEPFVDNIVEDWVAEHGPATEPPDDAPINDDVKDAFVEEIIPFPEVVEDPDRDVRSWLPDEAIRLAEVGGASPGGNADWITWPGRSVGKRVLEILREHGFELVEDQERVRRMWGWPDSFDVGGTRQ
jgi:hypothetical protein